jgi:hypothetical protein
VSRGEFEALKRFGDYEELSDGTLMRMEGNKECRIYCKDAGRLPIRIITQGFAAHEDVMEEAKKDSGCLDRLYVEFEKLAL